MLAGAWGRGVPFTGGEPSTGGAESGGEPSTTVVVEPAASPPRWRAARKGRPRQSRPAAPSAAAGRPRPAARSTQRRHRSSAAAESQSSVFLGLSHIASICFTCFKCPRIMLQVFYMDISKSRSGCCNIARVSHTCCKCFILILHFHREN
jgi:hypothetical protein